MNFFNKQKLKEYSNTKPILKVILKGFLKIKKKRKKEIEKRKEELGWRKPQLESHHLNKPEYRCKHEHVKKKKTSKSYNVRKESKKT